MNLRLTPPSPAEHRVLKLLEQGRNEEAYNCLKQNLDKNEADLDLLSLFIIFKITLDEAYGSSWDALLSQMETNENLTVRTVSRYFRLKFFHADYSIPGKIKRYAQELDENLPLWIDVEFKINNPCRSAAMLDFGEFYYLPIPKNASSTIASQWCKKIHNLETINPHSFFPNPFFKTVSLHDSGRFSQKPVFVVTRPEQERSKSYYYGNVLKRNSLSKSSAERFMGLPTKPDCERFFSDMNRYKLVFDDCMHHMLPVDAYISPVRHLFPIKLDIKKVSYLSDLYPDCFDSEVLSPPRRLMSS